MSVTVSNVPHHSPAAVRSKVPVEPPNSSNGPNSKSSSSPRPLRLNVTSSITSQVHSSSPRNENVISRPTVGISEGSRRSVAAGPRKRASTLNQLRSRRQMHMEVGLENLGNTCFMNSSLQCLLHIQPFVSYFLGTDIDKVLNSTSPMRGLLASAFAQLVRDIFNASAGSSIAPLAFQKVIGHFAPHLLDNQQQDCQEFLRFLLDGMSEDLCRKSTGKSVGSHNADHVSPKSSSARLVVSRTKDKMTASGNHSTDGGSTASETGAGTFEELEEIERQNNMFEKSSSLVNFKLSDVQQDWSDSQGALESDLSYDQNEENRSTKISSASRLRVQVELAGLNNSPVPFPDESRVSKSRVVDCNRLDKMADPTSSRASPLGNRDRLRGSNRSNTETFPDWFATRQNDTVEVGQSDVSSGDTDSMSKPASEQELKTSCSLDLPCLEIEPPDIRTPSSHRMRFKLPNLLGPISSFARERGEKVSRNGSLNSPIAMSSLPSPSIKPDSSSPHRAASPMRMMSMPGTIRKSPSSGCSSLATTMLISDIRKVKSGDSIRECLDKDDCWDSTTHREDFEEKNASEESEKAWTSYMDQNDSVVTDIFAGQLQSTIECLTCRCRSFCFDPFLDLSVPIPKRHENKSKWRRQFSIKELSRCPLEECIEKFTGEEILDGENMYTCSRCAEKRKCTKKLSIFKYPRILVIHIKRFRYSEVSREKISTDVIFPLRGLDLGPYLSTDRQPASCRRVNADSTGSMLDSTLRNLSLHSTADGAGVSPTNMCKAGDKEANFRDLPPESNGLHNDSTDTPHISVPVDHTDKTEAPFEANLFPPIYDLMGASHHCGTLSGGHYVAHVDTNAALKREALHGARGSESDNPIPFKSDSRHSGDSNDRISPTGDMTRAGTASGSRSGSTCSQVDDSRWMCFNDEHVSPAATGDITGPSAYVLFYRLREY